VHQSPNRLEIRLRQFVPRRCRFCGSFHELLFQQSAWKALIGCRKSHTSFKRRRTCSGLPRNWQAQQSAQASIQFLDVDAVAGAAMF